MRNHSISACEKLVDKYLAKGGEVHIIIEGVLGLGTTVCTGANLKTAVIQERFINSWCSGHTVRFYNECPKKYVR